MSTIKRTINTVTIRTDLPLTVFKHIELNIKDNLSVKEQVANSTMYHKVKDTIIELEFHQMSDAKLFVTHFKTMQKEGNDLQSILLNIPAEEVATTPKETLSAEVLIEIKLPKAIKIFRQYPMVNTINVEGWGNITRDMATYQGRKVTAINRPSHYEVDNVSFGKTLAAIIEEKVFGEFVTSAIMSPEYFVCIKGEHIVMNYHEKEVEIHQSFIARHGEEVELTAIDGSYYEAGKLDQAAIPSAILNIRTVRS